MLNFRDDMETEKIVNKVAASGIVGLDLRGYRPELAFLPFDIASCLDNDLMVREKAFSEVLNTINWKAFQGNAVAVYCSVAAIIPQWVFMSVAVKLAPYASAIGFGNLSTLVQKLWIENIEAADLSEFYRKKVAIQASPDIPEALYLHIAALLEGKVKTLMYGEPGFPKVIIKYK